MRTLLDWLAIPAIVGLSACQAGGGDDQLPVLFEDFPQVPQSGATQPFEVSPCYTISLPYDMLQVDVQGIDSNVARFDSGSSRVTSDCGAYDTNYGFELVAQQDVVIEGFEGILSQYAGALDLGDQIFSDAFVLHLTRPGGLNGSEHLNIAVYSDNPNNIGGPLGILASVRDVWP